MRKFLLLVIMPCVLFLPSLAQDKTPPSKDLQVMTFASPDLAEKDSVFVTQQDSLEIRYLFSCRQFNIGFKTYTSNCIVFTITNLSAKPFFIDWQKSIKTHGGVNKSYYNPEITLMGTKSETDNSVNLSGNVAPIQETILPKGNIYGCVLESADLNKNYTNGRGFNFESVGKYKTHVYGFYESNSPVKVQNFLVLSKTPNFSEPVYLSHRFYVSKIAMLPKSVLKNDKKTYVVARTLAVPIVN